MQIGQQQQWISLKTDRLLWYCKSNLFQLMNLQDYLFSNLRKNFKFHFYLGQLSREHFICIRTGSDPRIAKWSSARQQKCMQKNVNTVVLGNETPTSWRLHRVLSMYLIAKFKHEICREVWLNLCNSDHVNNKALLTLWTSFKHVKLKLQVYMSTCQVACHLHGRELRGLCGCRGVPREAQLAFTVLVVLHTGQAALAKAYLDVG